jgi:predicted alpha/beta-fold hydrolase
MQLKFLIHKLLGISFLGSISIVSMDLKVARSIVSRFTPTPFNAPPLFLRNPHYQTIIGSGVIPALLKDAILGTGYGRPFTSTEERFETPDGDFFDAEFTNENIDGNAMVIVLHGLESAPKSALVTKMAIAFHQKGFQCCLVSFRGCSGEPNRGPGAYHLGFTDDVDTIVTKIHDRYGTKKRIYLSGFSLGGNCCLKFLGELGEKALSRGVYGAAVSCVPFDPVASQDKLAIGFNRFAYAGNFLIKLKQKAEIQILDHPDAFDIQKIRECRTLGEFDEEYIAKIYGFRDKIDYYRSTGAKWWISKIRVPAISINALDDPFIDEDSLPTQEQIDSASEAPVRLVYHSHGGHCGFSTTGAPEHGFMAEELSRALAHIEEALQRDITASIALDHM